jgi:ribosomal protein S18 acetylase RimI-like enzyme
VELTDALIESYLALVGPRDSAARRAERAAWMRSRVLGGHLDLADVRVLVDRSGEVYATIGLDLVNASVAQLYRLYVRDEASREDQHMATSLLREAIARAHHLQATRITTRVHDAHSFPEYQATLEQLGFTALDRRIEFIAKLSDLPGEGASPFSWRSMAELPREAVVELLDDVLQGDLSPALYDSADEALREMLKAPDLNNSDDCVHVGLLEGALAALVIAQVQTSTGWASITQLGLHGNFRGRGLGAYVHRHGFDMLRAQGGAYYRDGTSLANTPMRRLFEKHGCREYARMTDWGASLRAAPA